VSRAWYSLCHGAGLKICDSCRRNVSHNPKAAQSPYQPFVATPTSSSRCPNWMARPVTPGEASR